MLATLACSATTLVDQALAKFNQLKPCSGAGLMVFAEEMDIAADGDCFAVGAMVMRGRPAHQKERVIADENEITRGNEQTRRLLIDRRQIRQMLVRQHERTKPGACRRELCSGDIGAIQVSIHALRP